MKQKLGKETERVNRKVMIMVLFSRKSLNRYAWTVPGNILPVPSPDKGGGLGVGLATPLRKIRQLHKPQ